jgi:hypothetical protein
LDKYADLLRREAQERDDQMAEPPNVSLARRMQWEAFHHEAFGPDHMRHGEWGCAVFRDLGAKAALPSRGSSRSHEEQLLDA